MKHKWIQSLTVLVLVLGIMVSLPLYGSAAPLVDVTQPCSLSVKPGSGEIEEDLAKAGVVLDLYMIGSAVKNEGYDGYTYRMADLYAGLTVDTDITNEGWQELAQSAAKIALKEDAPVVTGAETGSVISKSDAGGSLSAGLYLLIARGADIEDYITEEESESGEAVVTTTAHSEEYTYFFTPVLISLPGKEADEEGNINSANPGEWLYDLTVSLKPEREERYGSLSIVKTLRSYEASDAATFVFHVEVTRNGEVIDTDVVSLTFTEPGQKTVLLDKVPLGTQVTVTEVYSGSSYSPVGDASMTVPIEAEKVASVNFINDYDGHQNGGHGITNRFVYDEDNGWSWFKMDDNSTE